ncbi:MAG: Gfo/Idh/MocA family oxidoreductase [Verrucomicrobiota bacterium]
MPKPTHALSSRRRFLKGATMGGLGALAAPSINVLGANDEIRVAVIGLGGRGAAHVKSLRSIPGVTVAAVCDPDASKMNWARKDDPGVEQIADFREILERDDIDAITTAAPNHWHAAMTVMGCQAGKHVYVEKPVSHNIWEGRKMVEAARKYDRIVQGGTQQRSCPAPQEAARDLAEEKFGKVLWVHCMKLNQRPPIGYVTEPAKIPEGVDYNLWCGPASDDPPMREKFHYDWHWQWNWGDGEMGNWAVHYTDDLCHMMGWNDVMPTKVRSGGGRFLWKDNGETPNMIFSLMDYNGIPVVVETRNLPYSSERNTHGVYLGSQQGNIIMCEGGMIKLARGGGKAYEPDGKTTIKKYSGDSGKDHFVNFIDAIRSGKKEDLAAEIESGHVSSGICHLANASYRVGQTAPVSEVKEAFSGHEDAASTVDSVLQQIEANGGSVDEMQLGPELTFDPETEKFTGDNAEAANAFVKTPQREEFAIPESV